MEKNCVIMRAPEAAMNMRAGRHFRILDLADAPAMCALEKLCFSLPWSLEQCRGALGQRFFKAFGLFEADSLVAYISFFHCDSELEIVNLAVHPGHRHRGHGFNILGQLLQAAAKMGIQKAVLEVRESNLAAVALYEKTGFHRTGLRPRYYTDTGENALIYCFEIKQRLQTPVTKD